MGISNKEVSSIGEIIKKESMKTLIIVLKNMNFYDY